MGIIDVTDETFEKEVLKSDMPVVIDVWAPWCGPCRMYSPIIEEAAKEYEGKIKFVKVNADDNKHIDEKFSIMSIPTTLLIKNGTLKASSVGAVPKNVLKKWIDENL